MHTFHLENSRGWNTSVILQGMNHYGPLMGKQLDHWGTIQGNEPLGGILMGKHT